MDDSALLSNNSIYDGRGRWKAVGYWTKLPSAKDLGPQVFVSVDKAMSGALSKHCWAVIHWSRLFLFLHLLLRRLPLKMMLVSL